MGFSKYWSGNEKERRKESKPAEHNFTEGNWSFLLLGSSESQGRPWASVVLAKG